MSESMVKNLHVMVIDDQHTMRSIIRQLLEQHGIHNIAEAGNGKQAIKHFGTAGITVPDVVICDLHMDEMDGMEFVAHVRRGKAGIDSGTPVIILTGEDDVFVLDVTQQVGATLVLKKPVTGGDLLREIETAIGFSSTS